MHEKQRLRRTMMFIPGNNPGMMRDAHIYGSDSLMFDLEDSVSMAEKDGFLPYSCSGYIFLRRGRGHCPCYRIAYLRYTF